MSVDDVFTGIAPTTFSLMRSRLVVHGADATLFAKTLEAAAAKGIMQDLGTRPARERSRRRTRLQALLAATVANFSRLGVLGAFDSALGLPVAA